MKIYPYIEGLNEFKVTKPWSNVWNKLNHSIDRRYNIDSAGNVTIDKEIFEKDDHIFFVANGKLIGTNNGEWGGQLIFKNDEVEYNIIDDNICGITNFKNNLYVLTGLSHMGGNEGNITKINNVNKKWIVEDIVDLETCPEIFLIFENLMYIITFDGLVLFDGIRINKILSNQFWQGLYPETMFINTEIIAIGLRGCIVIIDKNTYNIKCYK